MKNLTDEKLIEKIRSENKELFEEIVNRYEAKLKRYVDYLTGKPEVTTDVIQETFIKAFVNLNSFNTHKKFSSWIYRIAHNEAINHIKKYRKEVLGNDLLFEFISDTSQTAEERYEKNEIIKDIKEKIDSLKIKYSEPLILFFLEEKSYEEISDILRIPVGTVGTRINRGKKLLKEKYE